MTSPGLLSRQGHRLLQLGVVPLLATSFEGFAIPHLAAPPLGRSVHALTALSAVLLIVLGLMWPRLELGAIIPLAAGSAHGSEMQEAILRIVAYSSGPAGIVSFALILRGLRT